MGTPIDFTEWTDAQLEAASTPRMIAMSPQNGPLLLAEIERRKAEGTWRTDGSHDRVAEMIASNPGLRGGRRRDGEAAQGARRPRRRR